MSIPPTKSMQALWQDSYLEAGNEGYLEDLYEDYLADPEKVNTEWRQYFDNLLQRAANNTPDVSHAAIREEFARLARQSTRIISLEGMTSLHDKQQECVIE